MKSVKVFLSYRTYKSKHAVSAVTADLRCNRHETSISSNFNWGYNELHVNSTFGLDSG